MRVSAPLLLLSLFMSAAAQQANPSNLLTPTRTVISGQHGPVGRPTAVTSSDFSLDLTSVFPSLNDASRRLVASIWSCEDSNNEYLATAPGVVYSTATYPATPATSFTFETFTLNNNYTTTLCDGVPRLMYSGGTPSSGYVNITYSTAAIPEITSFLTSAPTNLPCKANQTTLEYSNCGKLSDIWNAYDRAWSAGIQEGVNYTNLIKPTPTSCIPFITFDPSGPTTNPFENLTATTISTISGCNFEVETAKMLYWPNTALESLAPCQTPPPMTNIPSFSMLNGTNMTGGLLISDGFTYTSPSVYIEFNGLTYTSFSANDSTSWSRMSTVYPFRPEDVSTMCINDYVSKPMTWRDMYGPMQKSAWDCQMGCENGEQNPACSTIAEVDHPNAPLLWWPNSFLTLLQSLNTVNPDFCSFGYYDGGIFDPPQVLTEAGGLIPVPADPSTTAVVPITQDPPTPIPTIASPPMPTQAPTQPFPPPAPPAAPSRTSSLMSPPSLVVPSPVKPNPNPNTGGMGGVIASLINQPPAPPASTTPDTPAPANTGQTNGVPALPSPSPVLDPSPLSAPTQAPAPPADPAQGIGGVIASLINQPPTPNPLQGPAAPSGQGQQDPPAQGQLQPPSQGAQPSPAQGQAPATQAQGGIGGVLASIIGQSQSAPPQSQQTASNANAPLLLPTPTAATVITLPGGSTFSAAAGSVIPTSIAGQIFGSLIDGTTQADPKGAAGTGLQVPTPTAAVTLTLPGGSVFTASSGTPIPTSIAGQLLGSIVGGTTAIIAPSPTSAVQIPTPTAPVTLTLPSGSTFRAGWGTPVPTAVAGSLLASLVHGTVAQPTAADGGLQMPTPTEKVTLSLPGGSTYVASAGTAIPSSIAQQLLGELVPGTTTAAGTYDGPGRAGSTGGGNGTGQTGTGGGLQAFDGGTAGDLNVGLTLWTAAGLCLGMVLYI